jgi:hypothetical protein
MTKWATDSSLAKRLQIKRGYTVRTYHAPENYLDLLGDLPEGAQVVEQGDGPFDVVHLFALNSEVVNKDGPAALAGVKPDGVLWISYPKGTSKVKTDLNRDKGWEAITDAGWTGIAQVSVDATWSATRFRPADKVGK